MPSLSHSSSRSIAQAFGQAAATYSAHAHAQRHCAQLLWALCDRHILPAHLPAGALLEVGCGTGFLSRGLVERFGGERALEITDLAPAMVQQCQLELKPLGLDLGTSQFYGLDAEQLGNAGPYALICSSFALQWFQTPQQSLVNLSQKLVPGGWLLLAFPSDRSFPQWHEQCAQLGLPKPGNFLPKADPLIQAMRSRFRVCIVEKHWLPLEFERAIAFFQHFRAIGAATAVSASAPDPSARPSALEQPARLSALEQPARLSARQLRQLIHAWDQNCQPIRVDYQAILLAVQV